jgi:general secretion pathway protein M
MRILDRISQIGIVSKASGVYAELESRDRYALIGLAAFFSLLFIVVGIWQPALDYAARAEVSRNNQRELITWMNSTAVQARATAGNQTSARKSGQSLLTIVQRTAKNFSIKPDKLQPEGNDEVSVWFVEPVAFNMLLSWLEELQLKHGVLVRQISVDKHEQSGKVIARIVLKT